MCYTGDGLRFADDCVLTDSEVLAVVNSVQTKRVDGMAVEITMLNSSNTAALAHRVCKEASVPFVIGWHGDSVPAEACSDFAAVFYSSLKLDVGVRDAFSMALRYCGEDERPYKLDSTQHAVLYAMPGYLKVFGDGLRVRWWQPITSAGPM